MEILFEFLKIILPAVLVLYAMYLTVKSFIQKELHAKSLEIRSESVKTVLPLRIQAYERMCLFLERIMPNSLMLRLNEPGLSAKQLQHLIIREVRDELNHNLSQQMYMSDELWRAIKNAVEDIITTVNKSAEKLDDDAKGTELAKQVINDYLKKPDDIIADTLSLVKEEIRQVF